MKAKKIFKSLFSRFTITSLIIISEFVLFLYFLIDLYQLTWLVLIVGILVNILVFLHIVNMDMNPDYKLPWISIVLIVPILGGLIFLMFHSNRLGKKDVKKFNVIKECLYKHKDGLAEKEAKLALHDLDLGVFNQFQYIVKSSNVTIHRNTNVEYFDSGEKMFPDLLADLENAKKFIFIEFFIIEPGVLWNTILNILKEKANAGVDCRVIYDDMGSIKTLPNHYDAFLRKNGIKASAFNPFKPILSAIHNNRDHRKIVVVDGIIGYTGGINLADEYINKKVRFGYWKDAAVRLEGEATRNLTALFLSAWDYLNGKISRYETFLDVENTIRNDSFVMPFGDGPKPLYKEEIGKTVFLNLINQATKYVYITTPYLIIDHELMNSLKVASKRGVEVCIITPHIPDKRIPFILTRSSFIPLIDAGCHIYEFTPGFIHAKNVISDDKLFICGTINFDYRSLVHHFECAMISYNSECLFDAKADFIKTIAVSHEVSREEAKLSVNDQLTKEFVQFLSPLM